jgi:hypothetical protein
MPIVWTTLTEFEVVAFTMAQPWLLVREVIRDPLQDCTHLQLTATGSWGHARGPLGISEPDGIPGVVSNATLVADCPVGALIGKFGGSSASLSMPATGGTVPADLVSGKAFAIGSYCITEVPALPWFGPLFISFNGFSWPFQINQLKIVLKVTIAPK